MTDIINFIPRLLVAGIVLMIGVFIADFIKDIITTVCQSLGIPSAKMIGGFVFWFIFLTALVSAMGQAGIETDFIMSNLSLLLAGGVFAFALGYGIASRDMMANFLASFYTKEKVNILDKYGNKIGYYKVDTFDKSKINIYDSYGALVKTAKNDAFDNSKTNTYDVYGAKQGSIKQDAFNSKRQNVTDKYGNVVGYTEVDTFDSDKINKYDKNGKKVGYYKKNTFSGEWEYHNSPY